MQYPDIDLRGWAVDAACSKNPGPMEYRCVELATGKEVFHVGVLQDSTNNIGEFLAVVHALALLKQKGLDIPIYSDSKTALSWVRNKAVKTTLKQTGRNEKSFELLSRALNWLKLNSYPNKLLKWNTEAWGEIPADFGRK
jgi:ribonuclease HI